MPGIGKMFHFFDPPRKASSNLVADNFAALHTVGGSPRDLISLHSHPSDQDRCGSDQDLEMARRPSIPKLSMKSAKGVWSVHSIT